MKKFYLLTFMALVALAAKADPYRLGLWSNAPSISAVAQHDGEYAYFEQVSEHVYRIDLGQTVTIAGSKEKATFVIVNGDSWNWNYKGGYTVTADNIGAMFGTAFHHAEGSDDIFFAQGVQFRYITLFVAGDNDFTMSYATELYDDASYKLGAWASSAPTIVSALGGSSDIFADFTRQSAGSWRIDMGREVTLTSREYVSFIPVKTNQEWDWNYKGGFTATQAGEEYLVHNESTDDIELAAGLSFRYINLTTTGSGEYVLTFESTIVSDSGYQIGVWPNDSPSMYSAIGGANSSGEFRTFEKMSDGVYRLDLGADVRIANTGEKITFVVLDSSGGQTWEYKGGFTVTEDALNKPQTVLKTSSDDIYLSQGISFRFITLHVAGEGQYTLTFSPESSVSSLYSYYYFAEETALSNALTGATNLGSHNKTFTRRADGVYEIDLGTTVTLGENEGFRVDVEGGTGYVANVDAADKWVALCNRTADFETTDHINKGVAFSKIYLHVRNGQLYIALSSDGAYPEASKYALQMNWHWLSRSLFSYVEGYPLKDEYSGKTLSAHILPFQETGIEDGLYEVSLVGPFAITTGQNMRLLVENESQIATTAVSNDATDWTMTQLYREFAPEDVNQYLALNTEDSRLFVYDTEVSKFYLKVERDMAGNDTGYSLYISTDGTAPAPTKPSGSIEIATVTKSGVKITAEYRTIKICGSDERAEIYNLAGVRLYSGYDREIEIAASGVYVVAVGNEVVKIILR